MTEKIKVVITGAAGKMGREMTKGLLKSPKTEVVGAVDLVQVGTDIGVLNGFPPVGVTISKDLAGVLDRTRPQVLVDFTVASAALENAKQAVLRGVCPVIGTTGLAGGDLEELHILCEERGIGAVVAPNFSLGAVLMMHFARQAARYFPHVEIIEIHHEQKLDAPSGTALKTAELMAEVRAELESTFAKDTRPDHGQGKKEEKIKGVRGGEYQGFPIHSLRLPGAIAHQEVIFGGQGQLLTIRHDTTSREAFLPGLLLAIEKVLKLRGVVYGLDKLLEL
ncbi:dihydrodipicolinate reductase [Thermanaeromonas toyohensis ToBE]|uniref:4-hydroxy-tetrahydrodipicolinate reductase n=1 Tax=Thermanaeromonas toyohensis ToBE TaxID=698762 RepID=A0A1W1VQG4_9FIRM|nr:dihydrodipicolinate reductase [Thermanaeromonas toyohensis ToBE]